MARKLRFAAVFCLVAFGAAAVGPAFGQSAPVYYFSMRNLKTEVSASFIVVEIAASAGRPNAVGGCNSMTFYATAADASIIAAARTSGEVVQLHRGDQGESPQSSAVMCVVDGQGNT